MFMTQQTIQAETAWRRERTTRLFRKTARRVQPAEQAAKPAPRHARRALRPTTVA
ncbi:hypothetical protein HPO96_19760 [Kribbella sandramycini]|uniref:Uncharacterized protein n=1 Tax=Kribbella sandramycini TaxID=60450 RepID=A0A7Y4P0B8_9ACTN|nr:hypothetical protein [Kribbella sandramycini]MBB6564787.1 hypothetical protein [Kribbella sandramycini]NOL42486.1 hypothetical protein [Kribbella sandramycini]